MPWKAKIACATVLLQARRVWAQLTTAHCQPEFDWMQNPFGENPCKVASVLEHVCGNTPEQNDTLIPALIPGQYYSVVGLNDTSPCACNTVVYSLLSACAACQSASIISWGFYKQNCPAWYENCYPFPVEQYGPAIPAWTLMNFTDVSSFNVTTAQSISESLAPSSTALITSPSPSYFGTCITVRETNEHVKRRVPYLPILLSIFGLLVVTSIIMCAFCACKRRRRARAEQSQPEDSAEAAEEAHSMPPQTAQVSSNLASRPSSQVPLVSMEPGNDSGIQEVAR